MWGHTFDDNRDLRWQFKIIRQANETTYVCQLYSWLDGSPTNCEMMHTDALCGPDCKLYATNAQMLDAAERIMDRQYDERRVAREIQQILKRA